MENQEPDNLDALIHTGISDPIAIGLAESLLQEAGIPFFRMDAYTTRERTGAFLGWWDIRVPREMEAQARRILQSVEESK